MDAIEYLDSLRDDHPELSDWCNALSDLYQRKLWCNIAIMLQQFTSLEVFKTGDNIIQLYHNFISHFELKINPLWTAHLAIRASQQYQDIEAGINFLKGVTENLQSTQERHLEGPILFINTQIAIFYLAKGDHRECKNFIENGATTLGNKPGIDAAVYAAYYWVACQYQLFIQDPTEFHKNAILYSKYATLEHVPYAAKKFIAFHILVTALLGDNIYNFGELLELPIMKDLIGSSIEWIYRILEAFNSGDLVRYQELCSDHESGLSGQPDLVVNEKKILEKLNVVRLMEFIFSIPLKDRGTIPLTTIAEHMKLTVKDVEHLLMKSLSAHLMEGIIDEVDGTVHVSWIRPKVLKMDQVESLRHQLDNWLGKVQGVITSVETGTPEFVAPYSRFMQP